MSVGRGVLLGGRLPLRTRTRIGYGVAVWLPVAIMLAVILRESTDSLSSAHTGPLLRPLVQAVFGPLGEDRWEEIHHLIRKTGHFLGYGTLGLTWLRAWLLTWLMPMRLQGAGTWRATAFRMAVCCTALVATLDELHQTYIPSRTGLADDVVLDTCGAITLCCLAALLWGVRQQGEIDGQRSE